MFCDKCGAGLKGDEYNCPICGKQLKEGAPAEPNPNNNIFAMPTTTKAELETNAAIEAEKHNAKVNKMKGFLSKHKKPIIAVIAIIVLAIAGYIIFDHVYDYTKINWNNTEDSNISFTGPRKISLSVDARGKKNSKIDDIKFEVTGGEIVAVEGSNVEWQLPSENGEYTITAIAPSGKRISKNIKVFVLDNKVEILNGVDQEDLKDEDDDDKDGLTNKEEKEKGTNPLKADSDNDGLIDKYEIETSKTDPLKYDTDEDGISDGDELVLELDPLKSDSKGDGVKDSERTLTYKKKNEKTGVEIEITGKGNVASTTVDILSNNTFANMDGILNKVYNFYTKGNLTNAKVTIPYTVEELTAAGLTEDDLTLYYFNEETKQLETVETEVDKTNKVLIVNLSHFSKYVIGKKSLTLNDYSSDILFVIDNSVSMYTTKQMEEAGYNSSTGAVGNDKDFERIKLTKNMIDKFTGNYRFAIAEFAGNYKSVISFTKEREEVKNKADSLKSNWTVSLTGTNIIDALKSGTQVFSPTDTNGHYLILMTDGKNTSGNLSSNKSTIISLAKQHNVKICVIGLGKDLDNDVLSDIAKETGCNYYSVSEASALEKVYENVGAQINYNLVDTDGDGKTDGTIIADSGFIPKRDGFSFANFSSVQSMDGNCYGMAFFADLYYQKKLPMSKSATSFAKLGVLQKREVKGYNLNGTYFSGQSKNLYDFKFKDDLMNVYFFKETPDDYRDRVENGVWKLKNKYYDGYIERGFVIQERGMKGDGFDKFERAFVDVDSEKLKNTDNEGYQLLQAIYYLFSMQNQLHNTSFTADPDKAYKELVENLSNKVPAPSNIGGHEINSIKLIQDNKDANKFVIEVYDNNFPGETRYVYVTRSETHWYNFNWTQWTNDYVYEFKYDKNGDGELENINYSVSYVEFN
ncbi:MAG: VWA domain-containing protein [Bacilli bacterium]|nr:VWA domain-containing protein [Bacilli bacterium]